MKKNLHALKALPAIFFIAFSLLQSCKNLDEPLPTPGHLSKIKDKWRVSRITTTCHDQNCTWKEVTNFRYNAYNKAIRYDSRIDRNGDTTPEFAYATFAYNAQQQLVESHKADSSWYQSPTNPDLGWWNTFHQFRRYSYDASGRVTHMLGAFWSGPWDSTLLDDLTYDINIPVTYEGDSVIYVHDKTQGLWSVMLIFDQNGNITRTKYGPSDEGTALGGYDNSTNVNSLATVPYSYHGDPTSENQMLPVFSRNNFTQVSSPYGISKYKLTYNKDSLVTKRTAYDSSGNPDRVTTFDYMKVQ